MCVCERTRVRARACAWLFANNCLLHFLHNFLIQQAICNIYQIV